MLEWKRGFTVIQFIGAMTVCGLLLVGLFVQIAKGAQRENQRMTDLATIEGMIVRYAEAKKGLYPRTNEASDLGSELHMQFDALRLSDPKTGENYVLSADFDECNGSASTVEHGPGYVSYKSPGTKGPYSLRICLEKGEFYIAE